MFKRFIGWFAAVAAVIGVLLASQYFFQPMSSDLSAIGQGQPALVLAYENFSPESGAVLNQLNRIRKDYQGVMNFVVADLGTPQGQAFARQHNLSNGAAVRGEGLPSLQFLKVFFEGMDTIFRLCGAGHPLTGNLRQRAG